jgi:hypothetical protein
MPDRAGGGQGWNYFLNIFVIMKIAELQEKDHEKDISLYFVGYVFAGSMRWIAPGFSLL